MKVMFLLSVFACFLSMGVSGSNVTTGAGTQKAVKPESKDADMTYMSKIEANKDIDAKGTNIEAGATGLKSRKSHKK